MQNKLPLTGSLLAPLTGWLWCCSFLLLAALCALPGCNRSTLDAKGYVRYLNDSDNGLVQEKEIDGLLFKAKLLTPELMALNELRKTDVEEKEWQQVYQGYKGLMYYNITIADKHGGYIYAALRREGFDENNVEEHLNFNGQRNLLVVSGADTSACVLYSLSKTYGAAKQLDIASGFEDKSKDKSDDYVLEINAGFLDRGLVKFRFKRNDIKNIPALTI